MVLKQEIFFDMDAWNGKCVAMMMDDTPYLIVDNQKLSPIGRINRIDPESRSRSTIDRQIFDVIDRVTISKEARQLSEQILADGLLSHPSSALLPLPDLSMQTSTPLLTYSPKLLR